MAESPGRGGSIYHVGVISDTHGLIRAEALNALKGSDVILHAGDIGSRQVLRSLRCIAPVVAVRGNMDREHVITSYSIHYTKLYEIGIFLKDSDSLNILLEEVLFYGTDAVMR